MLIWPAALEVQLERIANQIGAGPLVDNMSSLPKTVMVGSACSGSGMFELAARAVVDAMNSTLSAKGIGIEFTVPCLQ